MSLESAAGGPVRPAAVVNAEIRALVRLTRVWDEAALRWLARLQAEWRAAVAREQLAQAA